jgi:hypothetical protein
MAVITCAEHGTDITHNTICEKCVKKNIDEFDRLHTENKATISFRQGGYNSERVLVDGKPAISYHNSGYIEYEVPSELVSEIEQYIERRIKEYCALCECVECVRRRIKEIKL